MNAVRAAAVAVLAWGLLPAAPCSAAAAAWSATLADGTQASDQPLEHWFDSAAGAGSGHSFRWLRNRAQVATAADEPRIEFVGGDCLPGKVVAAIDQSEQVPQTEAHLLVAPAVNCDLPGGSRSQLRVLPHLITRIVRHARSGRVPRPNTAWLADSRRIVFQAWSWQGSAIRLLTEGGVLQVPLEDIDEIHFPQADSLETYFASLALLLPQARGRLLVCQTSGGLRATSSSDRLRLHHAARGADQIWFLLQPVWSLDALCVVETQAASWLALDAAELPLSWIAPVRSEHRAAVSGPWQRWRLNCNVQGGPLVSGGQTHAWGFGVHGFHALEFALPAAVSGFRTGVGLDAAAGGGGSAAARLEYSSGPSAEPYATLYQSPPLVGSQAAPTHASVRLPGNFEGARLRLVADSL
ncbi:MAG TPA: NPCBM/NEW2 domain-containing protein, partial [Pirellulales bacterium]|nr:NPCBM/NEW2 domain-containing protein [Pirellulales bacterium]